MAIAGQIPVYVINLKESVERREHMKRELAEAKIHKAGRQLCRCMDFQQ